MVVGFDGSVQPNHKLSKLETALILSKYYNYYHLYIYLFTLKRTNKQNKKKQNKKKNIFSMSVTFVQHSRLIA